MLKTILPSLPQTAANLQMSDAPDFSQKINILIFMWYGLCFEFTRWQTYRPT